jgi:oligopeptide/dipeptide ABC transporter ATP-binding protein
MKVHQIVGEPLLVHGMTDTKKRKEKVVKLMESVGLHANQINRYPHEFSGGQRQRIGLARAIALDPKLIVCDEPVSALDVSIQAQIINLFDDLRKRLGLAYLFIAHDLSVIHHISDRIAVMYLGKIVEITGADELYQNPLHPYTEALLSAVPLPDPAVRKKKVLLEGDVPDPANPPDGCNFHPRCKYARDVCRKDEPDLRKIGDGEHYSACHFAGELDLHGDKSN